MGDESERNEWVEARGVTRPCPTCGVEVGEAGEWFPFCSKRCRDVDLGNWFSGRYRISRAVREEDVGSG